MHTRAYRRQLSDMRGYPQEMANPIKLFIPVRIVCEMGGIEILVQDFERTVKRLRRRRKNEADCDFAPSRLAFSGVEENRALAR
ncbi:MAG: hypothetical protein QOJ64_2137 [Acidobacteriota bacterium]|jgi:hypothetical protein|nr:hypothetical protein [Acidobacteriota bacterium]